MVKIQDLHDFKNHPFKVETDMALYELMQSIEKEGVISEDNETINKEFKYEDMNLQSI